MAKFTDYFKVVTPKSGVTTMTDSQGIGDQGTYANYTWYQRLIQGAASRITRYREYDIMDNDVEIARALDTLAEEIVGNDPNINTPIDLIIEEEKQKEVPTTTVMTLRAALRYWCSLHDWDNRLFSMARLTIKYGDCFFIRHRETEKWEYIHAKNVVAAIVDENDMTTVRGWQIKRDTKVPNSPYNQSIGHYGNTANQNTEVYASDDIVWFTLNDDMSEAAPFGESVLRAIYRAQKQKELLEDAIIIYRIQRAPERRVFYIDVGKMAPQRVQSYLEQLKNEIRQKKIPTYGGGADQIDSVYNPHSMSEDFFFAQRPDGKGSRVETLPGGQGLGELTDLEYFQNKVFRGLRIPVSYMTEGSEGAQYNDGKVGVAYIQELRFSLYISRLQGYINRVIDKEFKRYLRMAGIHVDPSCFKLALPEPENFGIYRQQALDADLLNTLASAIGVEGLSKRFAFKKYGQMTDEDLLMNERMRAEEMGMDPDNMTRADMIKLYNPSTLEGETGMGGAGTGMMAGGLGADMGFGVGEPLPGVDDMGAGPIGANPEAPFTSTTSNSIPPGNTGGVTP